MSSTPGPLVTRAYLRVLAAVSLIAWLSIGVQLRVLIGADGLLPIAPLLDEARREGYGFGTFPTLFWLRSTDGALVFVAALGAAASLFGLLRVGRAWLLISLPLYLSVAVAAQDFCTFQWDDLLLEMSALALFLDPRGPTLGAVWLQRALLVKLYLESGLAKALSPIGDWLSGSAMISYFQTAPLPTPLARWLHALPLGVLHASSIAVLVLEIVVPLFVFGPRPLRKLALILLTAFQLVNFASANYGFFVPLALALHLWMLDDEWLGELLRLRATEARRPTRLARASALAVLVTWIALSLIEARAALGPPIAAASSFRKLNGLRRLYTPLRVVDVYHLFASVTTERVEPIIEVQTEGDAFSELDFFYKPGALDRSLPFVAPHQPRVDFRLWFHGLDPEERLPPYLYRIEELLCTAPAQVASLFATPLPEHIRAVRIRYARYTFTRPSEPAIWKREDVFVRPPHSCSGDDEEEARR